MAVPGDMGIERLTRGFGSLPITLTAKDLVVNVVGGLPKPRVLAIRLR